MKPFSIVFTILFFMLNAGAFGQSNQIDFQVVEKNYPGSIEFENSVKGSENFYFNKSEIPVLYLMDSLLGGENINNLHLYVYAMPGEINFGKIVLTPENLTEYSEQLKGMKKLVSGRVIVHSNLVFTGEKGVRFKQKLEEISGLHFETR
jgi:hypothetical protein